MRDIVAQLKLPDVNIFKTFFVHYILNTLPQQYGLFKISYNIYKDKLSINELMTISIQEEEKLLMEIKECTYANKKEKGKIPCQEEIKNEYKYFFNKKKEHMSRIMLNFRNSFRRKVIQSFLFVMNLILLMLIMIHSGLTLFL